MLYDAFKIEFFVSLSLRLLHDPVAYVSLSPMAEKAVNLFCSNAHLDNRNCPFPEALLSLK